MYGRVDVIIDGGESEIGLESTMFLSTAIRSSAPAE